MESEFPKQGADTFSTIAGGQMRFEHAPRATWMKEAEKYKNFIETCEDMPHLCTKEIESIEVRGVINIQIY